MKVQRGIDPHTKGNPMRILALPAAILAALWGFVLHSPDPEPAYLTPPSVEVLVDREVRTYWGNTALIDVKPPQILTVRYTSDFPGDYLAAVDDCLNSGGEPVAYTFTPASPADLDCVGVDY